MRGPFVHRETLRWNDADLQGVINNAVYLTLLEQARFAYFQALDLLSGHAFPFLLGSTNIRFVRPARPGDTVDIEARVTRFGTKSFDMSYRVARGEETLAEATATLVWIDDQLQSIPIPEAARNRIRAHEDLPLG
jgi:acyl-CoA thioester hydrolase